MLGSEVRPRRLMHIGAILLAIAASACDGHIPGVPSVSRDDAQLLRGRGRAIDGDTVSLDIRLLGADAVERKQRCSSNENCWQCGKAAQDLASRLLKSGTATIRLTGEQSYGRPIGSVTIEGRDLGEAMIEAGYAVPTPKFLKRDLARADRYAAAYERAVNAGAGIHAGRFVEPSRWRRGERLECERGR